MGEIILTLDRISAALRSGFGLALLVAGALAATAWLERSRRVSAFGAVARFARKVCDPLIAPVERRVVGFGATHVNAPWWALLVLLVLGAIALGLLGFLRDALVSTYYATSRGPGGVLRLLIGATIALLQMALLVRVLLSWVGGTYSRLGRLATRLTEWFVGPLRGILPTIGMVDISPLVAYFALSLLRGLIFRVV
jgi:YggT family protein